MSGTLTPEVCLPYLRQPLLYHVAKFVHGRFNIASAVDFKSYGCSSEGTVAPLSGLLRMLVSSSVACCRTLVVVLMSFSWERET